MRKIFMIAFAAMSMAVMAQHVTPIGVEIKDLKLDSLRDAYLSQPAMYMASLKTMEQGLEQNLAQLKKSRAELKTEQAHAKEMSATIQEAFKLAGSLRKTYEQEEHDLIAMQKTIEKQLLAMGKKVELNQETRDSYNELLTSQQKELNYSLREVADRKRAITDVEEKLRSGQNAVQIYNQEVIQKAADITTLETQCKTQIATLKKEQKLAKSIQ
ncbi:MAG: hypothetical protein IJ814_07950 [Paludibacteraceae bacterium]|nr:hypothetical protein [Paludibacteraceae bacterium]